MIIGEEKFIVSTDEKWYKKYTGFPYAHLGDNTNSGIDCFNLIRYVYKKELDIEIPYDTADWCDIVDERWYQKTHDKAFEKGAIKSVISRKINKLPEGKSIKVKNTFASFTIL